MVGDGRQRSPRCRRRLLDPARRAHLALLAVRGSGWPARQQGEYPGRVAVGCRDQQRRSRGHTQTAPRASREQGSRWIGERRRRRHPVPVAEPRSGTAAACRTPRRRAAYDAHPPTLAAHLRITETPPRSEEPPGTDEANAAAPRGGVSGVCRPPQGEVDRCPKGAETEGETQTRRKAHLESGTPPSPPPAVLPPYRGRHTRNRPLRVSSLLPEGGSGCTLHAG